MFDNIGPAELLVLALVGMFVLGPERLPQAAAWVARTVRTVKDYASGARDQLRSELGPEFDDLRKPIEDLRSLRELDPRQAVRRHLFDTPPNDGSWSGAGTPATPAAAGVVAPPATPPVGAAAEVRPLAPGEPAPLDDDAT